MVRKFFNNKILVSCLSIFSLVVVGAGAASMINYSSVKAAEANSDCRYYILSGQNSASACNDRATTPISECEDLQKIKENLGGSYRLTKNVECFGKNVNLVDGAFTGKLSGLSLDGKQSYSIDNLTIDRSEYDNTGLFANLSGATIENLVLNNIHTRGRNNVGTLAGTMTKSNISNVLISTKVRPDHSAAGNWVTANGEQAGGLAGYIQSSTLKHVDVQATVLGNKYVGGIAGSIAGQGNDSWNDISVQSQYNPINDFDAYDRPNANIVGTENVGGIAGFITTGMPSTGVPINAITTKITNSTVSANIYAKKTNSPAKNIGGLFGNINSAIVENANFRGTIYTNQADNIGGAVGYITTSNSNDTVLTNITAEPKLIYLNLGVSNGNFVGQIDSSGDQKAGKINISEAKFRMSSNGVAAGVFDAIGSKQGLQDKQNVDIRPF